MFLVQGGIDCGIVRRCLYREASENARDRIETLISPVNDSVVRSVLVQITGASEEAVVTDSLRGNRATSTVGAHKSVRGDFDQTTIMV